LHAQVSDEHDARYRRKLTALAELKDATDDFQRGEILAGSGQWGMAAGAFGKAVEREPKNIALRYKHIIALVESGNTSGVRNACADLLERFGDAPEPVQSTNVAVFCRLATDAFADKQKLEALRGLAGDSRWAETLVQNGKADLAVLIFELALKLQEPKLGLDHPGTLATRNNLAQAYGAAGREAEAIGMREAMLKLKETKLGGNHPDTRATRSDLAQAYRAAKRIADTIRLVEQNLKIAESKFGPDHPDTLATRNELADDYGAVGRTAEAAALIAATLKLVEAKLGPDHVDTLASVHKLAHALEASRPAEAEPLFRRALDGYRKQKGPEGHLVVNLTGDLAGLLDRTGRPAEAEPLLRTLLDRQRAELPASDPSLAGTLANLGKNLLNQRKWSEAEPAIRECLAIRQKALPDDWSRFNAMSMLGGSLLGQARYSEAEPLLLAAFEGMKTRKDKIPPQGKTRLAEASERVVELYEALGQPEKAAEWRKKQGFQSAELPSYVFAR